jgi:hypothetical protein
METKLLNEVKVCIQLTDLILPHFCNRPKPEYGFHNKQNMHIFASTQQEHTRKDELQQSGWSQT